MPFVKVGRYDGPGTYIPDKYDPVTGRMLCRNCGTPVPKKNMCYCGDKCRLKWWRDNSPYAWGYLRNKAMKRDKGKCVKCGEPATAVHHIKPVKFHPELEFELSNLESVCDKHHKHEGMFNKRARSQHVESLKSKRLDDFHG